MSIIPSGWNLEDEIQFFMYLVKVNTVDGPLHFVLEDEMSFVDVNGTVWTGAGLASISDIEMSINGNAPALTLQMSYSVEEGDDATSNLMARVRQRGLDAVNGLQCEIYIQHLQNHTEFFAATTLPILLTSRTITNVGYNITGPLSRALSISVEGPFNLRSKPINGTFSGADQRRRTADSVLGPDPSLDYMPTNSSDAESLFGL